MPRELIPTPRLLSAATGRYGRYGKFIDFGGQSSGHASVGHKSIGGVTVDCEFLFRNSQWGVLGADNFPAGIMYLNLNFGPPQGCRVKSAIVTITLDENDITLQRHCAPRPLHPSGCPVQVTPWYGPRELNGQTKTAHFQSAKKVVPEVYALGNGAGGVGYESKKSFSHQARWSFHGQLIPGKGTWVYKTLRWDLSENELEQQSFHSSTVRTAFAFEHSGQPFLMKVDIDGKLESWNDRIRSKLKFGCSRQENSTITTLLDFEDYRRYTKSIDRIAEGLARAMEMENLQEVPIVVPDAIPGVSFSPAATENHASHAATGEIAGLLAKSKSGGQRLPVSSSQAVIAGIPSNKADMVRSDIPSLPPIETLRRIVDGMSQREEEPVGRIPGLHTESTRSSDRTVVDIDEEATVVGDPSSPYDLQGSVRWATTIVPAAKDVASSQSTIGSRSAKEGKFHLTELLELPAVMLLLQIVARIMRVLGYVQNQPKETNVKEVAGNKKATSNSDIDSI